MNFTTPTTVSELHATLKTIYTHYRSSRFVYSGVDITPLTYSPITYTLLTNEQLTDKAEEILLDKHLRETAEEKKAIQEKIDVLDNEYSNFSTVEASEIALLDEMLEKEKKELLKKIKKNGIFEGDIPINKVSELNNEYNQKIIEVRNKYTDKKSSNRATKTALQTKLANVDTFLAPFFTAEITAKVSELKELDEEKQKEVLKYNAEQTTKIQKYNNSLINIKAELELRYLDIRQKGYTKEELIEMGYYTDAIACVRAYYDTLTPANAYSAILADSDLVIYLEDYHAIILNLYRERAL